LGETKPAAHFICSNSDGKGEQWFVKRLGMVKSVWNRNGETTSSELISVEKI